MSAKKKSTNKKSKKGANSNLRLNSRPKKKSVVKKSTKKLSSSLSGGGFGNSSMKKQLDSNGEVKVDSYEYLSNDIPINIVIKKTRGEFVPIYELTISSVSRTTDFLLEKIRQELIKKVNLGVADLLDPKQAGKIEERFEEKIHDLVDRYFPDVDDKTKGFLSSYLMIRSLGLGNIELVMGDDFLEEICVNEASEPVWVYHKEHGWLKTNVFLKDEDNVKHYAAMIGRRVGRQISVLEPLLDAHLNEGDRVNATLMPITTHGNTITIRKFSRDPWTITRLVKSGTISAEAAAWVWMAMHYELSAIIAGGTASGKTSALNCFANFFPPNQRILSIEDTREIRLPKFLHWIPMNTRLKNAEGKGEISMGDLLVNSLRMRPDRILVGEVRRKREAETLFEAIHTGHSVYATFHANTAEEACERLTNPPIEVPEIMLPAISLVIVQFRNRRNGQRRTFQIAEIIQGAKANVLMQFDFKKDKLVKANASKVFFQTLALYTGMSKNELMKEINEKQKVIEYLVKNNIIGVDSVGRIVAEYYTNKDFLMKYVNQNKLFLPKEELNK